MSAKPEQQLKVGDWWYLPAEDKLVRRDTDGSITETADLDNLCQKALNYFLLNAGRLVTRDELLNDVWGVRDVSDGRISRVIRVLRVALGDNSKEPLYIETIPKRGFRFVAKVTVVEPAEPPAGSPAEKTGTVEQQAKRQLQRWFALLAAVIVLIGVAGWSWWQQQAAHPTTEQIPFVRITPISSMDGIELHSAVSPDGRYVVYSHSVDFERNYSLVLQDLHTMEKRILLKDADAGLHGSVWLADQSGLYYQRLIKGGVCEIRRLDFAPGSFTVAKDTLITNCGLGRYGIRLQLTSDQKFLIYPSKSTTGGNTMLTMFSLETGTSQQLTTPPPSSFGDYNAQLSPDGKRLAFLRDVGRTNAQVWIMSLAERELKMVYEATGFYPQMVSWSADQQELLLPSDDNALLTLNLTTMQLRTQAYTDNPIVELSQIKDGRYLLASGRFWQSTLWKVNNPLTNPSASSAKVEYSSGSDTILQPNPNPDGPAAVLSVRSGKRQLWLYYPDGRQQQLSHFDITDQNATPLFSPDGSKLLLRVGTQLWLLRDGAAAHQLAPEVAVTAKLSWGADNNSVYYTVTHQGQLQVFRMDLATGVAKVFSTELKHYEEAPDGSYAIQLRHNHAYFELIKSDSKDVINLTEINGQELASQSLFLRKNAIYFFRKTDGSDYEVYRYNLHTRELQGTGVKQPLLGRRFNVSQDERFIYLDDGGKGDIDVGLVLLNEIK